MAQQLYKSVCVCNFVTYCNLIINTVYVNAKLLYMLTIFCAMLICKCMATQGIFASSNSSYAYSIMC